MQSLSRYLICRDPLFTGKFAGNGAKLTFEARHTALSVDLAINVSDLEEECFVTNGD